MKESVLLTDWGELEQQADLGWIDQNLTTLASFAMTEHEEQGNGLIMVNTAERSAEHGHFYSFLPQAIIEEFESDDPKALVRDYDPQTQIVVMLVKSNAYISSYLVNVGEESRE